MATTVFLHFVHLKIEDDQLGSETRVMSVNFAARLETHLAARLNAGKLLALHFSQAGPVDVESFRAETTLFHQLFGDLQALNWVDPDGIVRIVTPEQGNAAALGLDLNTLPEPTAALARARASGMLQITPPITLAQGGTGFVAYIPMTSNGQQTGFLNIVFRAEPLMSNALAESPQGLYTARVSDGDVVLFETNPSTNAVAERFYDTNTIKVGGQEWSVKVAPSHARLHETTNFISAGILIGGGLLAVLSGLLTRLLIDRQLSKRLSDARFHDFAAASSDWFWEMDSNLRVTWCSDGIETFFGVTRADFLGRSRGDFRAPMEDDENWESHFADLRARRSFKDFVYAIKVDGSLKWVRTSGIPLFDDAGVFLGYRGIAEDVTKAVAAKTQVEQANLLLSRAVERMAESFSLWDADDRLVFGNRVFRDLNKDIPACLVPGTPFEKFLRGGVEGGHMTDTAGRENDFIKQSIARRHGPHADPFEITRSDGKILRIQEQKLENVGIATVAQDVTEQRRSEDALRASEERLALAVQQLTVWDWDLEKDYLYLSPGFAEALGYSADEFEEIKRSSVSQIIHPDDLEAYQTKLNAHITDPTKNFVNEHRFKTKAGEYKWYLAIGQTAVDQSGNPVRSTGVLTDISTRIELEERLHQSQKMEAIGQLTGGIAHDFNNLLAVILGNAELIEEIIESPELEPLVAAIIRASQRGGELTQRLLSFSRKQRLRPTVVDLSHVISGLPDLLRPALGETIELELSVDKGVWNALADPGQLENALLNLALNSRDAMPSGGRITINCSNATIRNEQSDPSLSLQIDAGDYVVVTVTDTGTGMSKATMDHACEPFFTTKGVGQGSGLGLSMVMGFAQQSGGGFFINSAEGEGTRVQLFLPKATQKNAVKTPKTPRITQLGAGEVILLVEDDPALKDITEQTLRNHGYRVVSAKDASSAKQALQSRSDFSLILSDVVLPGGTSGPEFVQYAVAERPSIKAVMMSGYPDDAHVKDQLAKTGNTLLTKPFRTADLIDAIRRELLG
ncbi:PAS domain S-box protein [Pelagimonas varians]|nr:PAS domain S-box protein [Pelagimonas varians]